MRFVIIVGVVFAAVSMPFPCFGQGMSLLGEDVTSGAETSYDGPVYQTSANTSPEGNTQENEDKANGEIVKKVIGGELLTKEEFILYLETIEDLNPLSGWQQITTKIHSLQYPQDHDLKVAGIKLFKNGRENEGWEKVTIPGDTPPKFVKGDDGKRIDIAHSFAGIRAGLNRGGVSEWAMSNVNTGWGDSLQVVSSRIEAAESYIAGAFTFNYKKTDKAIDKFAGAGGYKPPDQIKGNNLGLEVQDYLKDHPQKKLSEAFKEVWAEQTLTLKRRQEAIDRFLKRQQSNSFGLNAL